MGPRSSALKLPDRLHAPASLHLHCIARGQYTDFPINLTAHIFESTWLQMSQFALSRLLPVRPSSYQDGGVGPE